MASINKETNNGSSCDSIILAVVGTYPPRRCGIATFTADLCNSIKANQNGIGDVFAVAMDDVSKGYDYPPMVKLEIRHDITGDYRMAADYLNLTSADVVIVQHEFGIFGGEAGCYLNGLFSGLRKPVIATLHTQMANPRPEYRGVMDKIVHSCERLVVLSRRGETLLKDIYGVPEGKIAFIPHGIPDVPFVDPNFYKDELGFAGRRSILTFGLLSPNKGIEVMIKAMPRIIRKYPDALYIILGATHPNVLQYSGERYREGLIQMAEEYGVMNNILMINKFVEFEELCKYIGAADIYVTPYLNKEQISSGTLSYALGAGKAVVSTPYWYAEELLADGRGRLVEFGNSTMFADTIINLFEDEVERHAMRKRAYMFARNMLWAQVGQNYINLAHDVIRHRYEKPRHVSRGFEQRPTYLPEIKLQHLRGLTDRVGLFQHAKYAIPHRQHGYCTDDNARGLVFLGMHWALFEDRSIMPLINTCLSFLLDAFNDKTKRFKNFMSYDLKWLDDLGTEDSHGRSLWGLGSLVPDAPTQAIMILASRLFLEGLGAAINLEHPRAIAYTLVGIHCYLRKFNGDTEVRRIREHLAHKLLDRFKNRQPDWPWCDDNVTYANARLPHALILSGQWIPHAEMVECGLESLRWLLKVQTGTEGQLSLIGNRGWWVRGQDKARFDQQPIDAMTLVEACIEAYNATNDKHWVDEARRCFEWFLGRNDLNVPLYDFVTGGCRDGLHSTGVNENQGAESTLSWLIALSSMYLLKRRLEQVTEKKVVVESTIPRWINQKISVGTVPGI